MMEHEERSSAATRRRAGRRLGAALGAFVLCSACGPQARALEPIVYTVRLGIETQSAEIEALVPTDGRDSIELILPVWTPGYYVVEDFASRLEEISAALPDGEPLEVEKTRPNRWRVTTRTAPRIVVRYRLRCNEASVSLNLVGESYALLNGSGTYLTLIEKARRAHEVRLELPAPWTESLTGLEAAPGAPHRYRASDYLELADSPILAGRLTIGDFTVGGVRHLLTSAGEDSSWDRERMTGELRQVAEATRRFWGFLPFDRYAFLLVFREGGAASSIGRRR